MCPNLISLLHCCPPNQINPITDTDPRGMSTWHSVCDTMSDEAHVCTRCTDLAHVKNECLSVDHVKLADVHDGISKYSGQSIVASSSPLMSVSAYSLDRAVTPGSLLQHFCKTVEHGSFRRAPRCCPCQTHQSARSSSGFLRAPCLALSPLVCYDQPRPA